MAGNKKHFRASVRVAIAAVAMTVTLVASFVTMQPAVATGGTVAASVPAHVSAASAGHAVDAGIVKAADLSQFQPGNIISDAVFFNSNTMSEAQIQSFLESKVSRCAPGYTCLKDYYDTSRTISADAMCGAYAGGTPERASRIIFRVAQACGINPQVILVMLQKEQGLVRATEPSAYNYRAAMGQGCPDTAACDSRYYGLFNQVFWGAWQMKRYANPPGTSQFFTWYAPAKTWNVRWHPNAACGSAPVYIQNQATANLYYYTPYQPNAAALRAGYGEGDGCSSYGNRNFYQYFADWFGSTWRDHGAEMQAEWTAQGGMAGLGAALTGILTSTKNGGGFAVAYTNGSIYWTPSTGAKTVWAGPLRDYYFARGGSDGDLGWPAANRSTLATASGPAFAQAFTGGSVYASSKGSFSVREPLRSRYFSLNGALGALGWPTSDQYCSGSVCRQDFEGGSVVNSPSGVFAVVDPVRVGLDAAGGLAGAWGVPVSAQSAIPGGVGQAFAKGSVYYRPAGTLQFVSGAIRDHYFTLGGATGRLGFPAGAQQCASGACHQEFQFGWIISNAAGARVGAPAIDAAYAALGGAAGVLGARTSALAYYSFNGGGFAEAFANGSIYFKPSVGAHAVSGGMLHAYFATGGAAGRYGWPTSPQTCANGVCRQDFEGGSLIVSPTGMFSVEGAVRTAFDAAGGLTGTWGVPVSARGPAGSGFGQAFSKGSAYDRAGGPAYFVAGAIRDHYFALGGAIGRLGFPVAAQQCASGSCHQEFQFGWIVADASGARVSAPAIEAAYAALGGSGGVLGAPVGGLARYTFNGGGFAQAYANGAIYYKQSVGAHAVTGGVRTAYFAAGGAAGSYGWPSSAQTCSGGACQQTFERGTISAAG